MGYATYYCLEVHNKDFTGIEAFQAIKYLLQDNDQFYAVIKAPLNFDEIIYELFKNYLKNKENNIINKKILLLAQFINDLHPRYLILNFLVDEYESVKWYSWKEEMLKLSKIAPRILYCLKGEGEENGDLWRCYFKYGKSQNIRATIQYDPYDEEKLL